MERAFSNVPIAERPPKPRERGLTMLVDFGVPMRATEDLLELAGDAIDLAKVAVGTAALYRGALLEQKVARYLEHDVIPFPGGQFLEYAAWLDRVDAYLDDAVAHGFPAVEVSDNLFELSPARKREIIARAVDRGLRVLGEVGSKATSSDAETLLDDARGCLEAGAWKVLLEAAELFEDGAFRDDLARRVATELPAGSVIFELPGAWIHGTGASDVHALQTWLLRHLGGDADIGNVAPEAILHLEASRRNLGVHMRFDGERPA